MKCKHAEFTARHDGAIVCAKCFRPKSDIDRKERRNETRDITKPIEEAVNHLPGVWASRNTNGFGYHAETCNPVHFGLGPGSADIVGCVSCKVFDTGELAVVGMLARVASPIFGRFFGLEVKWPGKKLKKGQREWWSAVLVRCPGIYLDVVHSVDEALASVERCRAGQSPTRPFLDSL